MNFIRLNSIYNCIIIAILTSCTFSSSNFKLGEKLYTTHCSSCHGIKAEGLGEWYPAISDKILAKEPDRSLLALKIRNGISLDSIYKIQSKYRLSEMPANRNLNDVDISNILNYLNNEYWKGEPFTIKEIKDQLNNAK